MNGRGGPYAQRMFECTYPRNDFSDLILIAPFDSFEDLKFLFSRNLDVHEAGCGQHAKILLPKAEDKHELGRRSQVKRHGVSGNDQRSLGPASPSEKKS